MACATLVQIRSVYRTEWENLAFSVESGCDEWTLRVEETGTHRLLYTAHRGGVTAAQVAAAEFGISRVLGFTSRISPKQLAGSLSWRVHY